MLLPALREGARRGAPGHRRRPRRAWRTAWQPARHHHPGIRPAPTGAGPAGIRPAAPGVAGTIVDLIAACRPDWRTLRRRDPPGAPGGLHPPCGATGQLRGPGGGQPGLPGGARRTAADRPGESGAPAESRSQPAGGLPALASTRPRRRPAQLPRTAPSHAAGRQRRGPARLCPRRPGYRRAAGLAGAGRLALRRTATPAGGPRVSGFRSRACMPFIRRPATCRRRSARSSTSSRLAWGTRTPVRKPRPPRLPAAASAQTWLSYPAASRRAPGAH